MRSFSVTVLCLTASLVVALPSVIDTESPLVDISPASAMPEFLSQSQIPAIRGPARRLRQRDHKRTIIRSTQAQERGIDLHILLGQLRGITNGLLANQNAFHNLAEKLKNRPGLSKSGPFSNAVSNQLSEWRSQTQFMTPVVKDLANQFKASGFGAGKGAKYYNKNDKLQGVLQDINKCFKYGLNDINYIVYKIPTLGPVLGPIIYDIKCLLDEILNGSQNTLDLLLNGDGISGQLFALSDALGLSAANFGGPVSLANSRSFLATTKKPSTFVTPLSKTENVLGPANSLSGGKLGGAGLPL